MLRNITVLVTFAVLSSVFAILCNSSSNPKLPGKFSRILAQENSPPKMPKLNDEQADRSIVLDEKWGNVENGRAYDKAVFNLYKYTKIVLPDDASVGNGNGGEMLTIYMTKSLGFVGHPGEIMSIKIARNYMGCAVKVENDALVFATFGEWDSHIEGGASMSIRFVVPKGIKVEQRAKLSGEDSAGREWHGQYLSKPSEVKEGMWYGPATPANGWKGVPFVADPERGPPPMFKIKLNRVE
jgi:hypothetical protein